MLDQQAAMPKTFDQKARRPGLVVGRLGTLRGCDLSAKAREFLPQAPRNDDRSLASLIWDITGGHFAGHLEWVRDLAGRAA